MPGNAAPHNGAPHNGAPHNGAPPSVPSGHGYGVPVAPAPAHAAQPHFSGTQPWSNHIPPRPPPPPTLRPMEPLVVLRPKVPDLVTFRPAPKPNEHGKPPAYRPECALHPSDPKYINPNNEHYFDPTHMDYLRQFAPRTLNPNHYARATQEIANKVAANKNLQAYGRS